jgi:hypothetical protein
MASLSELKARLDELKNKKGSSNDRKNVYWTPAIGDFKLRLMVPIDDCNELKVYEQAIHYNIGSKRENKQFTCNKSTPGIGTDCPICVKAREYWDVYNEYVKEDADPEVLKQIKEVARKYTNTKRFYVPVYIKEAKEVKLWSLGETLYNTMIKIITTDEVTDFLDPNAGHDIKVTYSQQTPGDRRTAAWAIAAAMVKTPALGGKTLDVEAYKEIFDNAPTMEITASPMEEMEKYLDLMAEELEAQAVEEEELNSVGSITEGEGEEEEEEAEVAPAPKSTKKSDRISKLVNTLKDQENSSF